MDCRDIVSVSHSPSFSFLPTPTRLGWWLLYLQERRAQASTGTYLGIQILLGVGTSDWIHGRLIGVG